MGWAVWVCKCRACGHKTVRVTPEESEPPFECSDCGEPAVYVDPYRARRARAYFKEEASRSEG